VTAPVEQYEWLKVPEVAAALRISKMSVYRLIHTGELPASRFGRAFRVRRDLLASYMADCEVGR
jgi:excisionase family DNA binding protein